MFSSLTTSFPAQVQESAHGTLTSPKASAVGAGTANVVLLHSEGATAPLRIDQIEDEQIHALIAPWMRITVSGGGTQRQSADIRSSDSGKIVPGTLVGTQVRPSRTGTHELCILYLLLTDQAQVDVALRILVLSTLPTIVALPIGVFALLYHLLLSVRVTAQTATKAPKEDLDMRVDVHGDGKTVDLGHAFNAITFLLQETILCYDGPAKLQQRFVSDVSHELCIPLTTTRMAEGIVQDNQDKLSAHARRSAELLHNQTGRMEQILVDLLEISCYDAASALLNAEDCDLRPIALRVVGGYTGLTQRRNVSAEIVAQDRVAAEVDERRIGRVIRNLVVNVIGYADGTSATITLATTETDVVCCVRDHGVGMTQEVADHVFDRFYRAGTTRAHTTGGIGLGLVITAENVAIHGGRLQAYEEPGRGAFFLITLPKRASEEIVSRSLTLWEDE